MNVTRAFLFVTAVTLPSALAAQQGPGIARLSAEPASVVVVAGQTVPLRVVAYDSTGNVITDPSIRVAAPRGSVRMANGQVAGITAGRYEVVVTSVPAPGGAVQTLRIPIEVRWPPLARLAIAVEPGRLYAGVTLAHRARALHADSTARPGAAFNWTSSAPAVASVDRWGNVTAHGAGAVTITAELEGVSALQRHTVVPNPVTRLVIQAPAESLRTGDVTRLVAEARRADGSVVADVPITWSFSYAPHDTIAAPGATGIVERGLFAAETPGRYTLLASAGAANARATIDVRPRDVRRRISVTGRGTVNNVHTSDLWPWTGRDGRDYALVGTWGGDGWAYVFDITDLANPVKSDSVQVNARTINDVTVSPDGRYGVLSREGASDRVNGVVIIDLANPAHPTVASTFSEDLTGGVHNTFATNDYLFCISGGDKYVIIDVRDIRNPRRVGEYNHPNSRVHDVWVHNGIAYSSEWGTGVVAVDVGNGRWGGTIQNPRLIATYPTTSGATHEIFPYIQRSTGKVYLFLGDEIMNRQGRVWEGTDYWGSMTTRGGIAQTSAGYTHIVDFTDPMNPVNVARYHQEEFGSHDIIVEDDVMYQAYYDGGLRVVDVSGELLGNLAEQGREIAVFKPYDPRGFTANAPFVMNAMPWKGHILFTDFNSGLWSARLEQRGTAVP